MAQFIKHIPCPRCGSSDANTLYDDGSTHCFSCGANGGRRVSPYILRESVEEEEDSLELPKDSIQEYPEHTMKWVGKYGISKAELRTHNVYYNKLRDQLIFSWMGEDSGSQPILWQARNFSPSAKTKCYTKGKPEDVLPIYAREQLTDIRLDVVGIPTPGIDASSCTTTQPILEGCFVIVEDPISAIKCARLADAMPVLGSDLSTSKLKRLAAYLKLFQIPSDVVVWLDGNMFHKAQRIASRLQMLGIKAKAVYTELDPKEYTDDEIRAVVNEQV